MSEGLLATLLDFGALGIFAGFLIWQHHNMQKRLDRLIEDFAKEVKQINESFDTRAGQIRKHYEAMLSADRKDYRVEREKLTEKITELQRDLLSRERESIIRYKANRDD